MSAQITHLEKSDEYRVMRTVAVWNRKTRKVHSEYVWIGDYPTIEEAIANSHNAPALS